MFRKAIVVDTHPEDHSVDLVLCDDGSRLTGVPVLSAGGGARTGSAGLPEVESSAGADKWDVTNGRAKQMEAMVGFMGRGNPFVVGFMFPQISQMTFEDKKRSLSRHQSDFYHTTDGEGNFEMFHPSGAYVRIAENIEHDDLESKNFDQSFKLDRNKDKQVNLHMQTASGLSSLTLRHDGSVIMKGATSITLDAPLVTVPSGTVMVGGSVVATGDVLASGVSLVGHAHVGVRAGPDISGPPVGAGSIGGGLGSGGLGLDDDIKSGVSGWSAPNNPGGLLGEAIRGVAADAMGIFRGAIFTRISYGVGNALSAIERATLFDIGWYEINGYNQGRVRIPSINIPFPADQVAIPESVFFDRVRVSVSREADGDYLDHMPKPNGSTRSYIRRGEVMVSRRVGETWVDDILTRLWGPEEIGRKALGAYGVWHSAIPAGILPAGTPTRARPDSPRSPNLTSLFEYPLSVFKSSSGALFVEVGKFYNQVGDGFGVSTSDFPIYWEVTEEELLENGEVLS